MLDDYMNLDAVSVTVDADGTIRLELRTDDSFLVLEACGADDDTFAPREEIRQHQRLLVRIK